MEYKKIRINSRVIEHLGKDLITSPEVAIIELLKNSFDAGSNKAHIHIYNSYSTIQNDNFLSPLNNDFTSLVPEEVKEKPFIIIEDIGCGMDNDILDSGFLEIGTEIKKDIQTNSRDVILGEKGIGRLATQRLGRLLMVETASANEDFANVVLLDWDLLESAKELTDLRIPYHRIEKKANNYTRLWIFEVNLSNFFKIDEQISLFCNNSIEINPDLETAIMFLVSPFKQKETINVNIFYNGKPLSFGFNYNMLSIAESVHSFSISIKNNEIILSVELAIKPWFIERTHRASIKPVADFPKYKKRHIDYKNIFDKYKFRYDYLRKEANVSKLVDDLIKPFKSQITITDEIRSYIAEGTLKRLEQLAKILPIEGCVYSFKRDVPIGDRIHLESAKELNYIQNEVNLDDLRDFLTCSNGIKLYRDNFRIGHLGNKDDDWLYLQQYRTVGQQFYRFDLGNTVGYVSLSDPKQEYIKEISSRLEINKNNVADIFKDVMNLIFNTYMYELNRDADSITKNILRDENLLPENIKNRVKQNINETKKILLQNEKIIKEISNAKLLLKKHASIDNSTVSIDEKSYCYVLDVIDKAELQMVETQNSFKGTESLLEEAQSRLKDIEVEAFNNYKLMANGLITETITHELHSIASTEMNFNIRSHFEPLKSYLKIANIPIYNDHLIPLEDDYHILTNRVEDIAALYYFLEKTFIKKGKYDEFILENLEALIISIKQKLLKDLNKVKIDVVANNVDFNWIVPKGVMLHVFYNLFTNSIYWIDYRHKRSKNDHNFFFDGKDKIVIEQSSRDNIIFYDTGTGIIGNMQYLLFDALQSGKDNNEGRGMGLYIVKRLLNSFGGDIELLEELNEYGNKFKFSISVPEECITRGETIE